MTGSALARAIARSVPTQPRCELCGAALPDGHGHLLDGSADEPLCACYPCTVLFDRPAASEGRYRRIPAGRRAVPGVDPAELNVPVGLAFFVIEDDGTVSAHYPSPAGATRWKVDEAAWQRVLVACPPLRSLRPRVQALLVNTAAGRREAWVVPRDDCFRLVATVRRSWRGLSGGTQVWADIDGFFAELRE